MIAKYRLRRNEISACRGVGDSGHEEGLAGRAVGHHHQVGTVEQDLGRLRMPGIRRWRLEAERGVRRAVRTRNDATAAPATARSSDFVLI